MTDKIWKTIIILTLLAIIPVLSGILTAGPDIVYGYFGTLSLMDPMSCSSLYSGFGNFSYSPYGFSVGVLNRPNSPYSYSNYGCLYGSGYCGMYGGSCYGGVYNGMYNGYYGLYGGMFGNCGTYGGMNGLGGGLFGISGLTSAYQNPLASYQYSTSGFGLTSVLQSALGTTNLLTTGLNNPFVAEQAGTWTGQWNLGFLFGTLIMNLTEDPLTGDLSGTAQLIGNTSFGGLFNVFGTGSTSFVFLNGQDATFSYAVVIQGILDTPTTMSGFYDIYKVGSAAPLESGTFTAELLGVAVI